MNNGYRVETIPFHVEHVKLMEVRQHELQGIFKAPNIEARLLALQKLNTGGTLVYKGCILGVMGYIELWPGVCEVWVLPSKHIEKYSSVFAKTIKYNLKQLQDVCKFHRIQVTAVDDAKHNRWLQWLGFECEGVLKKYSINKLDYKMWAKM